MNRPVTTPWWQRAFHWLPWGGQPSDPAAATDAAWRGLRRQCPRAAAAAARVPPSVRAAWQAHVADALPGLVASDATWVRSAGALAQFFEASRLQQAAGPCALPSRAADAVWHAWLAGDEAGLQAWQQQCFGQAVAHREAAVLGAPLDACLARTWAGACRAESLSPLGRRMPLVFALDGQLRVPTGWPYGFVRRGLVYRQIDGFGQPTGTMRQHAALAGTGLAALGLLTAAEAEQVHRRSQRRSGGSSGFDFDSSDAGSGDGCDSSDAGSSDGGSSCGGGD